MFENEKNLKNVRDEYYAGRIQTVIQNLNHVRIKAFYAENKQKAVSMIMGLIDDCLDYNKQHYHKDGSQQMIGFGDSLTLHEIDLFEAVYGKYAMWGGGGVIA